MTDPPPARRMLLVHAHPDDETIHTGATMAAYAAAADGVTLLTCTLGEEGEILVPTLAELEAARADQLGGWRISELDRAMAALGVTDHRFLGGAGRFRDSGMIGTPANERPRAFWRAAADRDVFGAAVAAAVAVIREIRPQVLISYDANGGYGHPDHVMAHRVAHAAVDAAGDRGSGDGEAWTVAKVYETVTPLDVVARDAAAVAARPDLPMHALDVADAGFGVDPSLVTAVVDAPEQLAAKTAALRAHATQVLVHDGFYALSNLAGRVIDARECYRLVHGTPAGPYDGSGRETDLFAGVA